MGPRFAKAGGDWSSRRGSARDPAIFVSSAPASKCQSPPYWNTTRFRLRDRNDSLAAIRLCRDDHRLREFVVGGLHLCDGVSPIPGLVCQHNLRSIQREIVLAWRQLRVADGLSITDSEGVGFRAGNQSIQQREHR
jgi:hypothetical protein